MSPQEREAPSSLQDSAGHGVRLNATLLERSRSHGLLGETSAHEKEAPADRGLHVQPFTQPHSQTVGLSCFSSHLRATLLNYLASLFFMLSFQLSKTRHVGLECLAI